MFAHRKTAKDRCPTTINRKPFNPNKPIHKMSIYERWMLAQMSIAKGEQPNLIIINGYVLRNVHRSRAPTTWHTIQHKIDTDTNVHKHNENLDAGDFTDDEEDEHDFSFMDSPSFTPSPCSVSSLKQLPDSQFASYLQAFSHHSDNGSTSFSMYENQSPMSDGYIIKENEPSMVDSYSNSSHRLPKRVPKSVPKTMPMHLTNNSHKFKFQANIYRHTSQNSGSHSAKASDRRRFKNKKYIYSSDDDEFHPHLHTNTNPALDMERTSSADDAHTNQVKYQLTTPLIPKKLQKCQSEKYKPPNQGKQKPSGILLPLSVSVTENSSSNVTPYENEGKDELVLIPVTRMRNQESSPPLPKDIPLRKNKGGRYFAKRIEHVQGIQESSVVINEHKYGAQFDHGSKSNGRRHKHTLSLEDIKLGDNLRVKKRRKRGRRKHTIKSLWFKSQAQLKQGKQPSVLAVYSLKMNNIRQHTARYQVAKSRISHHEITSGYLQVMDNLTQSRRKIDIDDDEFSDNDLDGSVNSSGGGNSPVFADYL